MQICIKLVMRYVKLIDTIADYLPGWKASLMNHVGRLVMVRVALSAAPVYLSYDCYGSA